MSAKRNFGNMIIKFELIEKSNIICQVKNSNFYVEINIYDFNLVCDWLKIIGRSESIGSAYCITPKMDIRLGQDNCNLYSVVNLIGNKI